MDELSLDFIQKCLKLDPTQRWTTQELMRHPLFDEDFRQHFEEIQASWRTEEEDLNLEIRADSIMDASLPLRKSFPEEFANINEMLT
jgi:serine/threonine protein kinase